LGETTADFDRLTDRAKTIERHPWKKCADTPLDKRLLRGKTWEISDRLIAAANNDPDFLDRLARYVYDADFSR
jgi:hypothetical protein